MNGVTKDYQYKLNLSGAEVKITSHCKRLFILLWFHSKILMIRHNVLKLCLWPLSLTWAYLCGITLAQAPNTVSARIAFVVLLCTTPSSAAAWLIHQHVIRPHLDEPKNNDSLKTVIYKNNNFSFRKKNNNLTSPRTASSKTEDLDLLHLDYFGGLRNEPVCNKGLPT